MVEVTNISRRSDGLYDMNITSENTMISKKGLSFQEVVFELEMIAYQKERENGTDRNAP